MIEEPGPKRQANKWVTLYACLARKHATLRDNS